MKYFLILILLISGCQQAPIPKVEPTINRLKEWPQKCEMCGTEWLITPYENPNEIIPPTIEWCINDGGYCEVGFGMIIEQHEMGESQELELRFLNHCISCKGCRCAAFEPKEWHNIIDKINEIRNK